MISGMRAQKIAVHGTFPCGRAVLATTNDTTPMSTAKPAFLHGCCARFLIQVIVTPLLSATARAAAG
jgi:hypothetical protein